MVGEAGIPPSTAASLTVSFFVGCDCNLEGVLPEICDDHGRCLCRPGVEGPRCDSCRTGSYSFPICQGEWVKQKHWSPVSQVGLLSRKHRQGFCKISMACGLSSYPAFYRWDISVSSETVSSSFLSPLWKPGAGLAVSSLGSSPGSQEWSCEFRNLPSGQRRQR